MDSQESKVYAVDICSVFTIGMPVVYWSGDKLFWKQIRQRESARWFGGDSSPGVMAGKLQLHRGPYAGDVSSVSDGSVFGSRTGSTEIENALGSLLNLGLKGLVVTSSARTILVTRPPDSLSTLSCGQQYLVHLIRRRGAGSCHRQKTKAPFPMKKEGLPKNSSDKRQTIT